MPRGTKHGPSGVQAYLAAFSVLAWLSGVISFGQTNHGAEAAGKAQQAIVQGRLGEAESLLEEAVRAEPNNPNYAYVLGSLYMLSGKPRQAIPALQKCLKITPGDWDARIALAQAYQKADADAEAIRTLGAAAPPASHVALWRFTKAFSLYRLGDAAGAAPLFKQLLQDKDMSAPANFFLANCYSEMTQYQNALPYYETAIESGQSTENKALNAYYYNYGLTLFKLAKYDQARDAFEESEQQFADDPLPWYYLGRCEVQLNHPEPAREALEMAIKKGPSFHPAYYQLARLYAAQGDQAKAQELYGKVSKELHRQLQESERLKFGNSHLIGCRCRAELHSLGAVRGRAVWDDIADVMYAEHTNTFWNSGRAWKLTRRELLLILAAPLALRGQGMISRGVAPAPRGKPSGLPFLAHFTDVAKQAGLTAPCIYGPVDKKDYLLEAIGCGVAFLDYDNDGWLDIFALCGTRFGSVPAGATNRLYKNNRDGTFTDVTSQAGLVRTGWASAVTVGDYNNDGFEDLFVTYYGENVLYRNNGDGTFTNVTKQAGLIQPSNLWGSGCTFLDYDRDGNLDLFVANYVDLDFKTLPKPGGGANCNWKGIAVNCGPRGLKTPHCYLFHNNGNGTFTDVSRASGISTATDRYAMSAVAADLDGDGWTDIYIACDSTPSLFFRNQHDGTFKEEGLERGVALTEDGLEQSGMGVSVGDADLDGRLDLLKTNFADDTVAFYHHDENGYFPDATFAAGFGVETRFICWGNGLLDLDNDGFPDAFICTGSIYPEVERKVPQYPMKTPRVVFRNLGNGRFEELSTEAGPGIVAKHSSRGCAFGDFDHDGDIDIVIINQNEPPSLLRNDLSGNRSWLKVLLQGTHSNRSAIGSLVVAHYGGKAQAQAVTAQSSFYSVNDRRLHFGLGEARTTDLEIRWANGETQKVAGVAANQFVVIREGAGIVKAEKWDGHR